jgi:outer membrane autotransporter protein
MAFLLPSLSYGANAVTLTLARNDVAFSSLASSANQAAVATAAQALGRGNALYDILVFQSDAGARAAFAGLAGELHADVGTALIDEARSVREAMLDRGRTSEGGIGLWARGVADWSTSGGAGAVPAVVDRQGVIGGADGVSGGFRAGAAAGRLASEVDVRSQSGSAEVSTMMIGAHAGWTGAGFASHAGVTWAWHDVEARRDVGAAPLAGTRSADYDGATRQLFAELSYRAEIGGATLQPFAGYSHVRTTTEAFDETGAAGSYFVGRSRNTTDFATVGLRAGGAFAMAGGVRLLPRLSAAYQRGWGDLDGTTNASFRPGGESFTLTGAGIGRDTLLLDGGVDAGLSDRVHVGLSATATESGRWSSRGGRATLSIRF